MIGVDLGEKCRSGRRAHLGIMWVITVKLIRSAPRVGVRLWRRTG
jgi:hypothetical protein